jgi:cytochrome c556
MKKSLLVASLFLLGGFADLAITQEGPPDPFSQPAAAVEARVGVHRLMGANLMDAGAMISGKKPFDGLILLNRADALAQLSQMSHDFFMVPGSYENSNARASIQDNADDYKDKERALVIATFGFRTAVRNRDPHSSKRAAGNVMKACDGCHSVYMKQPLLIMGGSPQGEH